MPHFGDVLSKLLQIKCITVLGLEAETTAVESHAPPLLGIFVIDREKNSFFNAIWITFRMFLEPFENTKFLRFGSSN